MKTNMYLYELIKLQIINLGMSKWFKTIFLMIKASSHHVCVLQYASVIWDDKCFILKFK